MDSKVMKKNIYWQSHPAIHLQCNEMRFDYHMFPFLIWRPNVFFSQDQITCISRDMFPNASPCSCKLIIKKGCCWSQNAYPRVFLCGLWVFLAPKSYGIILSLRRMPTERSPNQAAPKSFTWEGRSLVSRSSPTKIMRIRSSFLLSVKINVSWNPKTTSLKWNKHVLCKDLQSSDWKKTSINCCLGYQADIMSWWINIMSISVSSKISPANSKGNINISSVCSSKNYSSPLA